MLHSETVLAPTLELLKRLMTDVNLQPFRLVGGTALALQIGHRISVDLDLFSNETFEEGKLRQMLEQRYHFTTDFIDKETLKGVVDGVKLDFIAHKYTWIGPTNVCEGIRIASLEDIGAMKLNSIVGNGTRLKDFIDVAYLSTLFSLEEMVGFYERKYQSSTLLPLKALTYFTDINRLEPVRMANGLKPNWDKISKRLIQMVKTPSKVFSSSPL